jgi:hypothetical protein
VRKQNPGRPQPFSPQTIWRCRCIIHAQYANESVTAAEFRTDEIAVRAQCFAQCRDLKLQVLCRYYDARPHPADELFFRDERALCFQKDHEEIEGARAEFDRNTIGEQLPPSQ